MVKTILHEVCKVKGRDVYNYTSKIPGSNLDPAHRPHIFPYIDLNLSTMGIHSGSGTGATAATAAGAKGGPLAPVNVNIQPSAPIQQAPIVPPPAPKVIPAPAPAPVLAPVPAPISATTTTTGSSEAPTNQLPPTQTTVQLAPSSPIFTVACSDDLAARNILASIFKRIAEKDTQAIIDLYFFKEANPDQDIDGMLSSASTTFKSFITRGLHKVKIQAMAQKESQPSIVDSTAAASVGFKATAEYAAPLGPADGEAVLTRTTPPLSSMGSGVEVVKEKESRVGGENIAALRERMSQMQLHYNQSQQQIAMRKSALGIQGAGSGQLVGMEIGGGAGAGAGGGTLATNAPTAFSPLDQGAGAGDLESLQKRLQMLNAGSS